jgi:hypothetical protein
LRLAAAGFPATTMMSMRLPLSRSSLSPQFFSRSLLLRLATMLLLLGTLSACAVKTNSRGGLVYGVDTAALFGTEIGQFPLQDGGLGTLRREGKNFSVKLSGNQRVVPLNNVDSARIARTENVGTTATPCWRLKGPTCCRGTWATAATGPPCWCRTTAAR